MSISFKKKSAGLLFISRLAHPGGPLTTNKAAALAKFLERKLQDPNGLSSINPDLLELAVNNAKATAVQSTFPPSFSLNLGYIYIYWFNGMGNIWFC